jgi:hypothetical protein
MKYREIIFEELSSVPVKNFQKLFHVGSLDASHKDLGSYEGSGISVSLHPNEWRQIANLSGNIWQCIKLNNKFIDFYKLSKKSKAVIEEWAIRSGLAIPKTSWRVSFYDDEDDENKYFTFYDENKAKEEAESFDTEPEKIEGTLVSTPRLAHRMLQRIDGVECFDLIVVAYAEDVMKYDGVWWNEKLNVSNLSAPRGVIVPSMVSSWKFSKIN